MSILEKSDTEYLTYVRVDFNFSVILKMNHYKKRKKNHIHNKCIRLEAKISKFSVPID